MSTRLHGVTVRFHLAYWDGPRTGLASYQGQHVFWRLIENQHSRPHGRTRYAVYPLTKAEAEVLLHNHMLFELYVGTHTSYTNWHRAVGRVHPQVHWNDFYAAKRDTVDELAITARPSLGYFRWGQEEPATPPPSVV